MQARVRRPCLARIPEENRLVNEFRESPFAFLGVNCDQAIDDARKVVAVCCDNVRSL